MDHARSNRLLGLNAMSHLLVDGLCAATVFGSAAADAAALIALYNSWPFPPSVWLDLRRIVSGVTAFPLRWPWRWWCWAMPCPCR